MPATSVLVQDSVPGKPPSEKYALPVPSNSMTARDLIRLYVTDQVERFNQTPVDRTSRHQSPEERILNPDRPVNYAQRRDSHTECERALQAFSANGFFLLIDDKQVTDLDQEIAIKQDTTVTFLRLTPLVGG